MIAYFVKKIIEKFLLRRDSLQNVAGQVDTKFNDSCGGDLICSKICWYFEEEFLANILFNLFIRPTNYNIMTYSKYLKRKTKFSEPDP